MGTRSFRLDVYPLHAACSSASRQQQMQSTPAIARCSGLISALTVACALFLQTSSAFSSTWFVATNGIDSNSGTNINSPFATIKKAQGVASGGDVVYLRGGTYLLDNSHL